MNDKGEDRWTPWLVIAMLALQLVFLAALYLRLDRIESRLAELQRSPVPAADMQARGLVEARVPGVEPGDGPSKGAPSAPVTLVEFSDFSCGACRQAQPMLTELIEGMGEEVRLVYRHFPLDLDGDSFAIAVAAECAHRQQAFWEFHDRVFAHSGTISAADLPDHAAAAGLEPESFASCVSSEDAAAKVRGDWQAGVEWGVQGTPTFFVNGHRVTGMPGLSAMRRIIDEVRS